MTAAAPPLEWDALPPNRMPGMREIIASGNHPEHGDFQLARDVFSSVLWVAVTPPRADRADYSLSMHAVMDDFFSRHATGDTNRKHARRQPGRRAIDSPAEGNKMKTTAIVIATMLAMSPAHAQQPRLSVFGAAIFDISSDRVVVRITKGTTATENDAQIIATNGCRLYGQSKRAIYISDSCPGVGLCEAYRDYLFACANL